MRGKAWGTQRLRARLPTSPRGRPLRVLILGPINQVHVESLAIGVREQGCEVFVGGETWAGLPPSILPDAGIPVSVRTWPTASWLGRLLRETRPDVVHANWMPSAATAFATGASPLIAMAWGSDVYGASRLQALAFRVLVHGADMVMADSADLLHALERLGAASKRTEILNWGIDLERFSPPQADRAEIRRALGLPPGRVILSPRALTDVYNPKVIVRAFERVADDHDDVMLVLKHMRLETPDLGPMRHRERVSIIGHVPYERMADYFRAADVCVSIPSSDSSPRSVWEAMGCGTPCIVSDLPWVHELIVDGRDALISPIDEVAVADAMCRLLADTELAACIATCGRELVQRHRNREQEMRRLCEIYERVAADGARYGRLAAMLRASAGVAGVGQAVVRRRLRRHVKEAPQPG